MQEKKLQKTFSGEFDKLLKKLKDEENFAFLRFSDGELFMLRGDKLVLAENSYTTGDRTGAGYYPKEEQKDFDPERDAFYRDRLIAALQHRQPDYFKGLTGVVDEDIAGKGAFEYQLGMHGEGDDAETMHTRRLSDTDSTYIALKGLQIHEFPSGHTCDLAGASGLV